VNMARVNDPYVTFGKRWHFPNAREFDTPPF
jgi:hypothetical protein